MLENMIRTICRYGMLTPGDAVVVGLSGGADSVALLCGLLALRDEWNLTLSAVHINHNLRGEDAAADALYAAECCATRGIPFTEYQADVRGLSQHEGLSLEEAGRRLRYEYLFAALESGGADKIAVAHNREDNAETVLLNLLRGSGLKGLCGIPPVNGRIVRPLIDTSRADIETYLQSHGIPFRTDASNYDHCYQRNRIRHVIMPSIAEHINPRTVETLTRNAEQLRADEEYLTLMAEEAYAACVSESAPTDGVALDIDKLLAFPDAIKRRVIREGLRRVLGGHLKDIGYTHVSQVLALAAGKTGRRIDLPQGLRAQRVYGRLMMCRVDLEDAPVEYRVALIPEQSVYIPIPGITVAMSLKDLPKMAQNMPEACTKTFAYDRINTFLALRTRRPGDRIRLESGGRKLQDYFTDQKIPLEWRDRIPLLADGSDILWIMDGRERVNVHYRPVPGSQRVWVSVYKGVYDDRNG